MNHDANDGWQRFGVSALIGRVFAGAFNRSVSGLGNHEGCPYVCALCLLGIEGEEIPRSARNDRAALGMTGYAENDMRGVWDDVEGYAPILRI